MKIKHFSAENVHGYLSYDIDFRNDLTFLIGLNGSGKTTVLKLISGLLTPNYLLLSQIKFSEIKLILYDENKSYTISAKQEKEKLYLNFNNEIDDKYALGSQQKIEEKYLLSSQERLDELLYINEMENRRILKKFNESKWLERIKNCVKPIVLGLNRRVTVESTKMESDRTSVYAIRRRYPRQAERYESVDMALADIREMLHDKVRENSKEIEKLSIMFKEQVLVGIMNLEEESFADITLINKLDFKKELKHLKSRQELLDKIFPSLNLPYLKEPFDNIFNKTKDVLGKLLDMKEKNDKDNVKFSMLLFNWMRLTDKLDNIDKMIEIGKKFSDDIAKLNSSFNRLKNSLNLFFVETNKEVDINGEGDLIVKIKKSKGDTNENSIFELSSGEKQLIILFSQVAFADSNNDIFIIDEPELSLHLTWQGKFVDALLTACPEMQFILATHAPAIVNKNNRIPYCVNLSKMNGE